MRRPVLDIKADVQVVAAMSELAIPHLTTRAIFSMTRQGSRNVFEHNLRLLTVPHI